MAQADKRSKNSKGESEKTDIVVQRQDLVDKLREMNRQVQATGKKIGNTSGNSTTNWADDIDAANCGTMMEGANSGASGGSGSGNGNGGGAGAKGEPSKQGKRKESFSCGNDSGCHDDLIQELSTLGQMAKEGKLLHHPREVRDIQVPEEPERQARIQNRSCGQRHPTTSEGAQHASGGDCPGHQAS